MDNIIIRDARREESVEIARLMLLAWPVEEFLNEMPQATYEVFEDFIASFVAREGNIYSYENIVVAETEGVIAGIMCAYNGDDYQRLKEPVLAHLGKDSYFKDVIETPGGEYYIDSVAVSPDYRGRGIARMLFDSHLQRASKAGFSKAGLIVDVDKPEAERLYLSIGFRMDGYSDFFSHRMKHMVLHLVSKK